MTDFERTQRGFAIYGRTRDRVGTEVRIQQSSLATEPAIWVFSDRQPSSESSALHLTVKQATALRDALTAAIEDAPDLEPADADA